MTEAESMTAYPITWSMWERIFKLIRKHESNGTLHDTCLADLTYHARLPFSKGGLGLREATHGNVIEALIFLKMGCRGFSYERQKEQTQARTSPPEGQGSAGSFPGTEGTDTAGVDEDVSGSPRLFG